jgi:hypothetical protein
LSKRFHRAKEREHTHFVLKNEPEHVQKDVKRREMNVQGWKRLMFVEIKEQNFKVFFIFDSIQTGKFKLEFDTTAKKICLAKLE